MKLMILLTFLLVLLIGCKDEKKPIPVPLPPLVKIEKPQPKLIFYRKVINEEVRPIETEEEKDAYVTLLKEKR